MPTTGAVTANEIQVTLTAKGAFEDAVNSLTTIGANVLDSAQTLATTAMVTTAGAKFGQAMTTWCDDFRDIKNTLQWMATQLGDTAIQLQASNQQNTDAAAQIPIGF